MAQRPSSIDVTASTREFTLAGRTFKIRPLDDAGYAEFERWIQDQVVQTRIRNAEKLSDPEQRQRQIDRAFDYASNITIQSPEALNLMYSVDGATKLVFLYLRRDNPGLTEEELRKFMLDPETLKDAMAGIDLTEGSPGAPDQPEGTATKKD